MYRVMYNSNAHYVSCRAGVYYYTRHFPIDVRQYYASPRLSSRLRTKSYAGAVFAAQSVTQRLESFASTRYVFEIPLSVRFQKQAKYRRALWYSPSPCLENQWAFREQANQEPVASQLATYIYHSLAHGLQ